MQPTTLARAIEIAEKVFPGSMRETLVSKINEVREYLWKDQASRELYFQDGGCECVVCITDPCGGGACGINSFPAVLLPAGITSIRYLEVNGRQVKISSERIPNTGCGGSCSPCTEGEILNVKSFLKHPIPNGYRGKLLFRTSDGNDKGKRVGVHYIRHNGQLVREDVLLTLDGAPTSHSPAHIKSITLPERCGVIDVLTEDFFSLGSYPAGIDVPQHTVIRLIGAGYGSVVRWEALREPVPVRYDSDLVEISGELDWKNLFQLLSLHFKPEKSASETRTYDTSVALATALSLSELRASQTVPVANMRPRATARFTRQIQWIQGRRISPTSMMLGQGCGKGGRSQPSPAPSFRSHKPRTRIEDAGIWLKITLEDGSAYLIPKNPA
jgi:hypothetical protein